MTDLYDLGVTPQNTQELAEPQTKRCGLCHHFEPNFNTCTHPEGGHCTSQNDCCELFKEDEQTLKGN